MQLIYDMLWILYSLFALITPGLSLLSLFNYKLKPQFILIVGLAATALLSFICYWFYYLNTTIYISKSIDLYLGEVASILSLLLPIALATFYKKNREKLFRALKSVHVSIPIALMLLCAPYYFSYVKELELKGANEQVHSRILGIKAASPDYFIMYNHAKYKLLDRKSVWADSPSTDWYRSTANERPPLQAALFMVLKAPWQSLSTYDKKIYYVVALCCQLIVIPAFWCALICLGLSPFEIGLSLLLLLFNMYLLHGVTFPTAKLMSGAFVLAGVFSLLPLDRSERQKQIQPSQLYLCAFLSAIGSISHTAVTLALAPIALLCLLKLLSQRGAFPLSALSKAIALYFGITMPYSILFALNEPWGSGGARFFLGDERNREIYENLSLSPIQAAVKSYQALGFRALIERKWEYLVYNFSYAKMFKVKSLQEFQSYHVMKDYYSWFQGLNLLHFGWLFALPLLKRALTRQLLIVGLTTLIITFFISFSGSLSASIVSTAAVLCIYLCLTYALVKLSKPFSFAICALSLFYWLLVIELNLPAGNIAWNSRYLMLHILSAIALLAFILTMHKLIDPHFNWRWREIKKMPFTKAIVRK